MLLRTTAPQDQAWGDQLHRRMETKKRRPVSVPIPPVVSSPPPYEERSREARVFRRGPGEMGFIGDQVESIRSMQVRQVLSQIISLGMIVTSALIIWKGLMVATGSESPVVVVLSGSMEPGFKRGDILFLTMSNEPIRTGEIVVFNIDGREIPIVHRVIKVHERQESAEVDILTKGDNNFGDDRLLYAQGQLWLQKHHIMGRAVGYLPYVGWVTIVMTEKPIIKYLLIGALGLLVITSKE
ncbi:hypothetical protein ACQ4PT_022750 [Festuca glaucescens]